MATFEPSPDLDPKIAQAIRQAMDALREELMGRVPPGGDRPGEAPRAAAEGDRMSRVEQAVGAIDRAASQTELLGTLLRRAGDFAERAMFLVLDDGRFKGWAAYGFEDARSEVTKVELAITAGGPWARAVDTGAAVDLDGAACAEACRQIGAAAASDGLLVPFALRGRAAGALYADRLAAATALDRPALRILTYVAAQALETLPLRRGAEPPAAERAAPEAEPEVDRMIEEVEVEPADVEDEGIVSIHREVTTAEVQLPSREAEEAEEAEAVEEAEVEEPTAVTDFALDEEPEREEPSAPAWERAAAEESAVEPEVEAEAEEREEEAELEAAEEPPSETLEEREGPAFATQEISSAGAPGEEEAPETPVVERLVDDAEVAPPEDLEGPGWAFGGEEEVTEDSRHDEARRLARLLVTEIKLYNEEKVREGREAGNIHEQLHDDIERSRRIYEERIDEEVRGQTDYFHEECVRILAGGDSTALGL